MIWGDNIFITAPLKDEKKLVGLCYDKASGKEKWRTTISEADEVQWDDKSNLASPSAATDGERVYFLFANAVAAACDFSGKILWKRDFKETHGAFATQWTYGSTTLLATDGPEKHRHAARCAYQDLVMVLTARWSADSRASSCADATVLECPTDSTFHAWQSRLEANLAFAKTVLEQKDPNQASKGIFQCPRCQSYEVDTEQKQTRSADEPMTIFCHCTKCDKRFVR